MKELRCLVFTEHEVISAVLDRRRKRREPLPEGTVTGVAYALEGGVHTRLFVTDDYGERSAADFGEAEVAAALVAYCMSRRIPLPAESDKTLYVINGNLTLMITMNFNKPPRMVGNSDKTVERPERGAGKAPMRRPRSTAAV